MLSDRDEPRTMEEAPIPSADTGDMTEKPSKPDVPRKQTGDVTEKPSKPDLPRKQTGYVTEKPSKFDLPRKQTGDVTEKSKPDLPRNETDDLSSRRLSSVHSDEDEPHTMEESPIPSADTTGDMSERPSKPDLPRNETDDLPSRRLSSVHSDEDEPHTMEESPIPSADTTGDMSEKPSKPDLPLKQTGDVTEKPSKPDLPRNETDDLSSSTVSRLSCVHSDEDEPHTNEESPIPSADTTGDMSEKPSKPGLPRNETDDLSSSTVSRLSSVHSDEDEPHTMEESPIPSADTTGDMSEKPSKPDLPLKQTGDVTEKPSKPDLPRNETDDLSSSTVSRLSSVHSDE
ncbi:MAG: uncharacterized protein KVP18_002197, partial [Porospora cf. gigantea A]|uniref:uncharacterized protein n=2 Tax=Porospora cf. gigantea A TaxID=2853593 RepID=UPI003559B61F